MATLVKKCQVCLFEGKSISQQLHHQRIHEGDSNFLYVCPLPTCHVRYGSYDALNRHISFHNVSRVEVVGLDGIIRCAAANCDRVLSCNQAICYHYLNDHLKSGDAVRCPLKCKSKRGFILRSSLASHLSVYHPGWRDDIDSSHPSVPPVVEVDPGHGGEEEGRDNLEDPGQEFGMGEEENLHHVIESRNADQHSSDDSSSYMSDEHDGLGGFTSKKIVSLIAKSYARMEGKLIISAKSVQKISKGIAVLSELVQDRQKSKMMYYLRKEGLTDESIERVVSGVLANDPFYHAHHKNTPGDSLTTDHLRKAYYHKHFNYVQPIERNLLRNPKDRSVMLYYVPVYETLKVMLEDPSIQAAVDESFSDLNNRDPNIIRKYTHGSVFLNRNAPKERIDIFIFQDSFRCAKRNSSRFKTSGVYMVLANLKPHQRSKLKAKRLVFLIMEKAMTSIDNGVERAFRKLVDDLKILEENGIEYKGKVIPFRLQFLIGDNLGKLVI